MAEVPDTIPLYFSSDQSYVLYLNGKEINFGLTRRELLHWRYECIDIAPYVQVGENVLAA
ncbi:MAG: hypothetical protein HKN87_22405 [Saprospiraceae bacterium]|nr:hypothetical protein [Saprospiraceae bacterium]